GTAPTSDRARAEMGSWRINLPHFQFKVMLKKRKLQDCFPGPGTYGPQGNPYALLEERDKRSAGTRGLMDSRTENRQKGKLFPSAQYAVGPGSYDPKPIERSAGFNQPPFCSSAKRFDRKYERLFTGNENPVGVGRYDVTRHEKHPRKVRYQSLYQSDTQRYLSNLKRDAYLL
ncbi:UNVERIFIED_CONTAM: hypothetical protein H355_008991, partial [Colinus virginianus]